MKAIGNYVPRNPFFLAPMEAVNCRAFRKLCYDNGAGLVYTDMIDADIFFDFAQSNGLDAAIKKYLNPDTIPLAIQIGGAKIETLVFTILHLQKYAVLIDYNIGCPLPYMLGKKGGAYLSKHPDQLYKIIKEIRKVCTIPLTVKLRSGWDDNSINALEIALELEKLKIDAITLHPRTRKQEYRANADWQYARKVSDALTIPFILSGDVTNVYLAHRALEHVKADYIMFARAAQRNPGIFVDLVNYWENKELPNKPVNTYGKNAVQVRKDWKIFLNYYNKYETFKFSQLKDHCLWFAKDCIANKAVTNKIISSTTENELTTIINNLAFKT